MSNMSTRPAGGDLFNLTVIGGCRLYDRRAIGLVGSKQFLTNMVPPLKAYMSKFTLPFLPFNTLGGLGILLMSLTDEVL